MDGSESYSDIEQRGVDFLGHFGVKGMHWGQRKTETTVSGQKVTPKKLAKKNAQFETQVNNRTLQAQIYHTGAYAFNTTVLPAINSKPEYRNGVAHDPKLEKKYDDEVVTALQKTFDAAAYASGFTNASGTRRFTARINPDGSMTLSTTELEHEDLEVTIQVKRDSKGFITSIEVPDNALAHFGIKGMKWGVRKASSEPGSDASDDVKRAHAAKQKIGKGNNTQKLSNKELQDLVTRMNLERQYSTLSPQAAGTIQKGQKAVKAVLATGNTINQVIQFANSPAGKALRSQLKKG